MQNVRKIESEVDIVKCLFRGDRLQTSKGRIFFMNKEGIFADNQLSVLSACLDDITEAFRTGGLYQVWDASLPDLIGVINTQKPNTISAYMGGTGTLHISVFDPSLMHGVASAVCKLLQVNKP